MQFLLLVINSIFNILEKQFLARFAWRYFMPKIVTPVAFNFIQEGKKRIILLTKSYTYTISWTIIFFLLLLGHWKYFLIGETTLCALLVEFLFWVVHVCGWNCAFHLCCCTFVFLSRHLEAKCPALLQQKHMRDSIPLFCFLKAPLFCFFLFFTIATFSDLHLAKFMGPFNVVVESPSSSIFIVAWEEQSIVWFYLNALEFSAWFWTFNTCSFNSLFPCSNFIFVALNLLISSRDDMSYLFKHIFSSASSNSIEETLDSPLVFISLWFCSRACSSSLEVDPFSS